MPTKTTQQDKLEMLKDLLFTGEHEALEDVSRRVELLEKVQDEQKELIAQIDPLVDKKLEVLYQNLQESLGPSLYAALEKQIEKDPEATAVLLSPLMSSLVKHHRKEQQKKFFHSLGAPLRYLKQLGNAVSIFFKGGSEEKMIQKQLMSAVIEQVLLIDRKKGNLVASYSVTKKMDDAKITVLCGIINDYIQKNSNQQDQHLELIPYSQYQIHLQGFVKHYVAVVIYGKNDLRYKAKLQDIIFNFYYQFMATNLDLLKDSDSAENNKKTIDKNLLDKAMAESFGNTSI
jgi:ribosomal protein S26